MKNYLLIILLLCAGAYNGYGQKKQPSDYHLQKAIDLMQNNGDEKEVMECLDQQLQETPDNADARVVRATLYLKQKKYGNALSDMNLAIKYYKNAGTTERDGRNDAKRLCTNVVTVSDEVKPKKRKMQGKAEYSRRTVCKSLPKKM